MAARRMKAKYSGQCRECGQVIEVGDEILWGRYEGARHVHCPQREMPEGWSAEDEARWQAAEDRLSGYEDGDDSADRAEAYYAAQEQARMDAEYEQGHAEAQQYLDNKRMYGAELAEQWEMEAELARWNRGDDY